MKTVALSLIFVFVVILSTWAFTRNDLTALLDKRVEIVFIAPKTELFPATKMTVRGRIVRLDYYYDVEIAVFYWEDKEDYVPIVIEWIKKIREVR